MVSTNRWTPELFRSLRAYRAQDFLADLIAGLTVGLMALPLAMAFAIASGVPPQAGIYTAVVAGFVISALGGSRVQIGGPTGAFVVIVAGIIAKFGVSGLLIVTVMAGAILLVMGFTGLGTAVKFIPRPVIVGFTNGIAILIASTQIKDFLGLQITSVPSEFLARMSVLAANISTIQWPTIALSSASLALILVIPRLTRRIPGSIVAVVVATACVAFFSLGVATIGSAFGGIPTGLPHLSLPAFRPDQRPRLRRMAEPRRFAGCAARWIARRPAPGRRQLFAADRLHARIRAGLHGTDADERRGDRAIRCGARSMEHGPGSDGICACHVRIEPRGRRHHVEQRELGKLRDARLSAARGSGARRGDGKCAGADDDPMPDPRRGRPGCAGWDGHGNRLRPRASFRRRAAQPQMGRHGPVQKQWLADARHGPDGPRNG